MVLALAGLAALLAGGAVVASGETGPNGVTATFGRGPDTNGFYTGPITIAFSGAASGDSCTPDETVYSGPGSNSANVSSTCMPADPTQSQYSDTFTFKYDDQPPNLNLPGTITEEATSPAGAQVNFNVTASDDVDGSPNVNCDAAPGTFAVGSHTVRCTATDSAGNSTQGEFTVRVQDTTDPDFGPTPAVSLEANAPGGFQSPQPVYQLPQVTDTVSGVILPGCNPGPGANFGFGSTQVTCTATDGSGNEANAQFNVTVRDTTPPQFVIQPQNIVVQARNEDTGSPATDPCIQEFLNAPTASDEVDGSRPVTNNAPERFPRGDTTVIFRTSDSRGNDADPLSAVVSVRLGNQGRCTIDADAPRNVSGLRVREGDQLVVLRWNNPGAPDLTNVRIYRIRAGETELGAPIYRGNREVFRDRGVRNGVQYQYVIRSFDEAGNHRPGISRYATPHRVLLLRPRDEARVLRSRPPTLKWVGKARARYYNVQLYRIANGNARKVLSRWPARATYDLTKNWRFEGRSYKLVRGRYLWYVWPGFGPRSAGNYGEQMGPSAFRVVKRR